VVINLSIIMVSRNDDYGGNLLYRMKNTINSLKKCYGDKEVEIILVEWNPPLSKPIFKDSLNLIKSDLPVRIIQVNDKIHKSILNSEKIPLFEYNAKNVGIRRAKGKYVLSTNPDILFSPELLDIMTSPYLNDRSFYRIDRYDIDKDIPKGLSFLEQINFAKKNVKCIHKKNMPYSKSKIENLKYFLSMIRREPNRIYNAFSSLFSRKNGVTSIYDLHLRCSGDFTLMSKKNWLKIKGHPELNTHSHLDSYVCVLAASIGLKQIILSDPCRIYHQSHERDFTGRPETSWGQFLIDAQQMIEFKKPIIYNDDSWGLNNYDLYEYYI